MLLPRSSKGDGKVRVAWEGGVDERAREMCLVQLCSSPAAAARLKVWVLPRDGGLTCDLRPVLWSAQDDDDDDARGESIREWMACLSFCCLQLQGRPGDFLCSLSVPLFSSLSPYSSLTLVDPASMLWWKNARDA